MTDFGSWTAVGLQTGLPAGNAQALGPFTFEFSGAQTIQPVLLTPGANGIFFPETPPAAGLWIFPPLGNTATMLLQGDPADTGIYLNPQAPTFLNLDPANYPTNVFVTTTDTFTITVQYV